MLITPIRLAKCALVGEKYLLI